MGHDPIKTLRSGEKEGVTFWSTFSMCDVFWNEVEENMGERSVTSENAMSPRVLFCEARAEA